MLVDPNKHGLPALDKNCSDWRWRWGRGCQLEDWGTVALAASVLVSKANATHSGTVSNASEQAVLVIQLGKNLF